MKEKTDVNGTKKYKLFRTPVFCPKGAQTIERKGVELPRSAKERGKSAEAVETKRVEFVDRFWGEVDGILGGATRGKVGSKVSNGIRFTLASVS